MGSIVIIILKILLTRSFIHHSMSSDDTYSESPTHYRPKRKGETEKEWSKRRRDDYTSRFGEMPGHRGKWPYLNGHEELELVTAILHWPDFEEYPKVSDIPFKVWKIFH
jgi:hypothetical protein